MYFKIRLTTMEQEHIFIVPAEDDAHMKAMMLVAFPDDPYEMDELREWMMKGIGDYR